jgi:hypothetical protein
VEEEKGSVKRNQLNDARHADALGSSLRQQQQQQQQQQAINMVRRGFIVDNG